MIRILRDHTPNSGIFGEDMVRTPWRHGEADRNALLMISDFIFWILVTSSSEIPCQVSSDAHEWCNDWGTVSTIRSVKLQ